MLLLVFRPVTWSSGLYKAMYLLSQPGRLGEPDGGVCPALRTTVVSVCQGAAHLDERTGQTLIDHHSVSNISGRKNTLNGNQGEEGIPIYPCTI